MAGKFDIALVGVTNPTKLDVMTFDNSVDALGGGIVPTGVKGINKLVSIFTKCLLTPAGTQLNDLEYGTKFASVIGNTTDGGLLEQVVVGSVENAAATIRGFQAQDVSITADEMLASADIKDLTVDAANGNVALTVAITNAAGEEATFKVG